MALEISHNKATGLTMVRYAPHAFMTLGLAFVTSGIGMMMSSPWWAPLALTALGANEATTLGLLALNPVGLIFVALGVTLIWFKMFRMDPADKDQILHRI